MSLKKKSWNNGQWGCNLYNEVIRLEASWMCCPDKAWRSHKVTHMSSLQSMGNKIIIESLVENFNTLLRASGMNHFSVNVWLVSKRSVSPMLWALAIYKKLIMVWDNVHSAVGQQYKQTCLDKAFHLFNVFPVLSIFCICMLWHEWLIFPVIFLWNPDCSLCLTDACCLFRNKGWTSSILYRIFTSSL